MDKAARTILLIENGHSEKKSLYAQLLEKEGYNLIITDASDHVNWQKYTVNQIDIILINSDINESIPAVLQSLNSIDLPVLFLIENDDDGIIELTEKFQSYGYIEKHTGFKVLNASIKTALNLHKKFSESENSSKESKYKLLVDYASEAIFVAQNNMLKFANPATMRFTGYSENELYSKPFVEFIHPDDRATVRINHINRIRGIEAPSRYTFRVISKTAEILWVEINSIIFDWNGSPATLNFLINISERKKIEEELLRSEAKYRKIFENVQDIFYQTDMNGLIIEISPSIERYSGFNKDELIGKPVESIYFNPADRIELKKEIEEKGEVIDYEISLKDKYNNTIYTSTNSHFMFDTANNIIGIEGSLRDISERKRAEMALVKSLKQKEILMIELQHRVKNNLGIISSLLSLEMPKLKDEEAKAVFIDAQTRIFSMAGIYEQLYSSGNIASVNLAVYIKDLAGLIFKTYSIAEGKIILKTTLDDIELDLRRTVPLGLILNELITNVLKYAYPEGVNGELKVNLKKQDENIILIVSDNGKGLPENFCINTTDSMGLSLVKMLVEQIGGKLNVESNKGTHIYITFQSSEAGSIN